MAAAAAVAMEQEAEATCLQSFELYDSESVLICFCFALQRLYILGTNSDKTLWRVLKIDRSEPSELVMDECSTVYTESERHDLLKSLDEEHRSTGGIRFVTKFYGIIGFIKFLGPYYMLIITEQKRIGQIFGHPVYQVTRTAMVELANSKTRSTFQSSKDENRNTMWTVALVHGFFKQDKFSISGKDIMLTLIARRSRHYAGTRYLKRGVNEKGRVANDVETEQIVYEAVPGPSEVSSVVQNRGSIPLFWSQETSKLNLKPNIICKFQKLSMMQSVIFFNLEIFCFSKPTNVLDVLLKVAFRALSLTEFFYCQVAPSSDTAAHWPTLLSGLDPYLCDDNSNSDNTECSEIVGDIVQEDISGSSDSSGNATAEDKVENSELPLLKPPKFQKGVLRTNCIDCLDRTNVAQSIATSTPDANLSTENVISGITPEIMENQIAKIQSQKLPEDFVQWVNHGDTFWY
nr:unnamed protein product [Digitaria exilis]